MEENADFSDDEPAPATAAQAAARAAFTEDKADAFYSSDEEETSSHTGSFVSASAASTTEPSKKFRVVIKASTACLLQNRVGLPVCTGAASIPVCIKSQVHRCCNHTCGSGAVS